MAPSPSPPQRRTTERPTRWLERARTAYPDAAETDLGPVADGLADFETQMQRARAVLARAIERQPTDAWIPGAPL